MPNYVATNLTITGDVEQLKTFREKHIVSKEKETFEGEKTGEFYEVFDFNTIKPCSQSLTDAISPRRTGVDLLRAKERGDKPAEIAALMKQVKLADDNEKEFGYSNWYDFCIAEWGTKWGACDLFLNIEEEKELEISYSTAWSPATPIFDKLHEMYPELVFEQHVLDEGMCFAATQRWDADGYSEINYTGAAMYKFTNDEFGTGYEQCQCGKWFQPQDSEGPDDTKCYNCNEKEEENDYDLGLVIDDLEKK